MSHGHRFSLLFFCFFRPSDLQRPRRELASPPARPVPSSRLDALLTRVDENLLEGEVKIRTASCQETRSPLTIAKCDVCDPPTPAYSTKLADEPSTNLSVVKRSLPVGVCAARLSGSLLTRVRVNPRARAGQNGHERRSLFTLCADHQ